MEFKPKESEIERMERELEEWEKPRNKFFRSLQYFSQEEIKNGDMTREEADRKLKQAEETSEDFMDTNPVQAALDYLHDEEYKKRKQAKFDKKVLADKIFSNKAWEIAKTNPRMKELLIKYNVVFKAFLEANSLYNAEFMKYAEDVMSMINSNEFISPDDLQEVPVSPMSDDFEYGDQVVKASSSALREIHDEMKGIMEKVN